MREDNTVLITGGAGFFGAILKRYLLERGYRCVSVDLLEDPLRHSLLTSVTGDIGDKTLMQGLFAEYRFRCVFHVAAILAHDRAHASRLWASNVGATQSLVELCETHHVRKIVFISSNCLWSKGFVRPVTEEDPPAPAERYGRSKLEAERILQRHPDKVQTVILRCPTIIDAGRMGLLTILFDFIRENRRIWVIGGGRNRYQFVYAEDLADACLRSMQYKGSGVFHVGSDHVPMLSEVYQHIIDKARSSARLHRLPRQPALSVLRLCHRLGLSPLGPYHCKMIGENFIFSTEKIKRELGWMPTLANAEMLYKAYAHYVHNPQPHGREVSPHSRPSSMGILRLVKWFS